VSKIDNTIIPELMSIESKLDKWIGPVVVTIDSKIDALEFDCCDSILSKLDVLETKIDQCCEDDDCCLSVSSKIDIVINVVGDLDGPSYSHCSFTSIEDIDNAQLNVIEWLKTIYRELRGDFCKGCWDCDIDDCGECDDD